jgi:hypothetical protein
LYRFGRCQIGTGRKAMSKTARGCGRSACKQHPAILPWLFEPRVTGSRLESGMCRLHVCSRASGGRDSLVEHDLFRKPETTFRDHARCDPPTLRGECPRANELSDECRAFRSGSCSCLRWRA